MAGDKPYHIIVLIPKKTTVDRPNDYKSVALMPVVMKGFERLSN